MNPRATRCRAAALAALLAVCAGLPAGCEVPPSPPPPPDPDATMARVLALAGDPGAGRVVFRSWCVFCHGDQQSGEPPTDFDLGEENPRRFRGYADLSREGHVEAVIRGYVSEASGRRNMPPFLLRLTPREIADVVSYERGIIRLTEPYREPERRTWEGLPDWHGGDLPPGARLR